MVNKIQCPECGAESNDVPSEEFCYKCGFPLREQQKSVHQNMDKNTKESEKIPDQKNESSCPEIKLEFNDNRFYVEGCHGLLIFRMTNLSGRPLKPEFSLESNFLNKKWEPETLLPGTAREYKAEAPFPDDAAGERLMKVKIVFERENLPVVYFSEPHIRVYQKEETPTKIINKIEIQSSMHLEHGGNIIGNDMDLIPYFKEIAKKPDVKTINDLLSEDLQANYKILPLEYNYDETMRIREAPKPERIEIPPVEEPGTSKPRKISPSGIVLFAILIVLSAIFIMKKISDGSKPLEIAQARDFTEELSMDLGLQMVHITGDSFLMGFAGGNEDEKYVHTVNLDDFRIGKYEVTNAQYKKFIQETGDHLPEWQKPGSKYNIETGSDDYYKNLGETLTDPYSPVVGVSWYDARAFCEWLTRKNENSLVYSLPTEAQWEYACRARAREEWKWCFGNEESLLKDFAWYLVNSKGTLHPVGSRKLNALKLHDMHGNVWEWCLDYYGKDFYATAEARGKNPVNTAPGDLCVMRGGSWRSPASECRNAARSADKPDRTFYHVGFRVAAGKEVKGEEP